MQVKNFHGTVENPVTLNEKLVSKAFMLTLNLFVKRNISS